MTYARNFDRSAALGKALARGSISAAADARPCDTAHNTFETPGLAGPSDPLPSWLAGELGVSPDELSLSSGLSMSGGVEGLGRLGRHDKRQRHPVGLRPVLAPAHPTHRESWLIRLAIWWTRMTRLA